MCTFLLRKKCTLCTMFPLPGQILGTERKDEPMKKLGSKYNKQEWTNYLEWLQRSPFNYHLDDGGDDGSGLDDIIWWSPITDEDLFTLKENHKKLVTLTPPSDWSELEEHYYALDVVE